MMASLALLTLAGCGGSDEEAPPPSATTPVTPLATGQPGRFNGPLTEILGAPDTTGDIYVAGDFTTYNDQPVRPVVRVTPNGSLNGIFLLSSSIMPSSDRPNQITSLTAADDGSGDLYVGEVVQSSDGRMRGRIWRVNSDGTTDSSFAMGEVTVTIGDAFTAPSLALDTIVSVGDGSGRIYVGGRFDNYNGNTVQGIVRVNTDGTLDPDFDGHIASALIVPAQDGSGDVYVLGYVRTGPSSYRSARLSRLNDDGSLDPAFLTFDVSLGGFTVWTINAVEITNDGSGDLLVGGTFTAFLPNSAKAVHNLVRLNPDGTLDTTSPKPTVDETQSVPVLAKAIDGTGDWYVVQATSRGSRLNRYRIDGSIDPTFTIGQVEGDPGSFISALLQTSDGSRDLYAGGAFSSYNRVPAGNIVRINRDGTLD